MIPPQLYLLPPFLNAETRCTTIRKEVTADEHSTATFAVLLILQDDTSLLRLIQCCIVEIKDGETANDPIA